MLNEFESAAEWYERALEKNRTYIPMSEPILESRLSNAPRPFDRAVSEFQTSLKTEHEPTLYNLGAAVQNKEMEEARF